MSSLIQKHNIQSRTIRSNTLTNYLSAVRIAFDDAKLPFPPEQILGGGKARQIIAEVKRWEKVANLRNPVSDEMFTHLLRLHAGLETQRQTDSLDYVLIDWIIFGRYTGLRASEYSQTTQSRIDKHTVDDNGTEITMAFVRKAIVFLDMKKRVFELRCPDDIKHIGFTVAEFIVQKNRANGQKVSLAKHKKFMAMCPVRAMARIFLRSKRLGKKDDEPIGVYRNSAGKTRYITATQIAEILQRAAIAAHDLTDKAEIGKYTAHSLRVWAAVLLNRAGCPGPYIQIRLRWKSDSFLNYLRNTYEIAATHSEILSKIDEIYWEEPNMPSHSDCNPNVTIDHKMRPILIENY